MSPTVTLKHMLYVVCAAFIFIGCDGELRPTHEDAKKAFAELVDVQKAHQEAVAAFALERGPEFAEVISQDTALVLKEWRRRQLQFEYLIDNDPERLRLRLGREGLISFVWTPEDSIQLAAITGAYPLLEQEIAALNGWLDVHKRNNEEARLFFEELESTARVRTLRRVYGRDEQAIVLRYRLSAILKEG